MTIIDDIMQKTRLDHQDIVCLLSQTDPEEIEKIRRHAMTVLTQECGLSVYYRGLIEFSNQCINDCLYCGIRKSNASVHRFSLSHEAVIKAAQWCADQGYGSVVLQSGERRDEPFISFVEQCVRDIKQNTIQEQLPHGLGITLCVGEQTPETYKRFFAAGAHRYLLRIETSSPELFVRLHPSYQRFDQRVACLKTLRETGFQVGTGVMIGLPGQTIDDCARDIEFFRDMDIDMIGMGPYIPHAATPLAASPVSAAPDRFNLGLRMIAAARIVLRNVNIAATTALQALMDDGREQGLQFGANVIMPQLTPTEFRHDYLLYDGKPCLDESAIRCRKCLEIRINRIGRTIGYNAWGDSKHFLKPCP